MQYLSDDQSDPLNPNRSVDSQGNGRQGQAWGAPQPPQPMQPHPNQSMPTPAPMQQPPQQVSAQPETPGGSAWGGAEHDQAAPMEGGGLASQPIPQRPQSQAMGPLGAPAPPPQGQQPMHPMGQQPTMQRQQHGRQYYGEQPQQRR